MARSRSRSGCRHIPPSVYCGGKSKSRRRSRRGSRRSGGSKRRRSRRSRSRKSHRGGRCGRRGRSRRRKSRRRRCRPGVKTRNPFLNYLRVFRQKHCGWPQCKIAIEGAKCWCKMNNQERQKYYNEACSMRKGKGRKKGRRRGRSRGRRGRRRSGKRRKSRRRKCP